MTDKTTRALILMAALLAPLAASHAAEDRTWKLMERQADGGIADIKPGLTKEECDFAKARIEGLPATPEEKADQAADEKADAVKRMAWLDEHPSCKGNLGVGFPGPSGGEGQEGKDGLCIWWSGGVSRFGHTRSFSPHDVESAECFQ